VVALQGSGRVRPDDTAAYRIAVTKLDQESAEVLTDLVGYLDTAGDSSPEAEARRRYRSAVEDHWRYSVSATVSSGSIEMQRITLARALLAS
jgi:translation elongation factor EF-Tu-like GTPase